MFESPVATLRKEPCHQERKQKASAASGLICSYSLMETARQPLVVRAFSHADARQSRSAGAFYRRACTNFSDPPLQNHKAPKERVKNLNSEHETD